MRSGGGRLRTDGIGWGGFLITSHEENDYYDGYGGMFYDSENASDPGLGPELVFDLWDGGLRTITPAVAASGRVGLSYGTQESHLNQDEGGGLQRLLIAPYHSTGIWRMWRRS